MSYPSGFVSGPPRQPIQYPVNVPFGGAAFRCTSPPLFPLPRAGVHHFSGCPMPPPAPYPGATVPLFCGDFPPPLPPPIVRLPVLYRATSPTPARQIEIGAQAPDSPRSPDIEERGADIDEGEGADDRAFLPTHGYREWRISCMDVFCGASMVVITVAILGSVGSAVSLGTLIATGIGKLTTAHPVVSSLVYGGLMLGMAASSMQCAENAKGCCTSPDQLNHYLLPHEFHNSNPDPWPDANCDLRGMYKRNARPVAVCLSLLGIFVPMTAIILINVGVSLPAAFLLAGNAIFSSAATVMKVVLTAQMSSRKAKPPKKKAGETALATPYPVPKLCSHSARPQQRAARGARTPAAARTTGVQPGAAPPPDLTGAPADPMHPIALRSLAR